MWLRKRLFCNTQTHTLSHGVATQHTAWQSDSRRKRHRCEHYASHPDHWRGQTGNCGKVLDLLWRFFSTMILFKKKTSVCVCLLGKLKMHLCSQMVQQESQTYLWLQDSIIACSQQNKRTNRFLIFNAMTSPVFKVKEFLTPALPTGAWTARCKLAKKKGRRSWAKTNRS